MFFYYLAVGFLVSSAFMVLFTFFLGWQNWKLERLTGKSST